MARIAIIPARSGSKGLKDKNIKPMHGLPLMAYTIRAALRSGVFDEVCVSTDSEKYAGIAREYGASVPFMREPEWSGDAASTWDTLRSVIRNYEKSGRTFDTIALLQPTSPLRDSGDIAGAFRLFDEKSADSVISVCEAEHSPALYNVLHEGDCMDGFIDEEAPGRRQDGERYYRLNGAIYILRTDVLMQHRRIYGERSFAYIMDKRHSIDIDDEFDFFLAEKVMEGRG